MKHFPVVLASLDTFWLPQLQRALSQKASTQLVSTWSLKHLGPNPDLSRKNIWPMHYALQIYKMFPALQFRNNTYSVLVAAFDAILRQILDPAKADAYIPLSGVWPCGVEESFAKRDSR